jgi:hypothetical protein
LDAGHARDNGLGFAAVRVVWLGTESFKLAGTAAHPQQNASHATLAHVFGRHANRIGPAHHAGGRTRRRGYAEKVPPMNDAIAIGSGVDAMFEIQIHDRLQAS